MTDETPDAMHTWPKTTPSGHVYVAPTTYDELCSRHTDAAQASVECWVDAECPPEPTWEMVGLAHREVERLTEANAELVKRGLGAAEARDTARAERDKARAEVERLESEAERMKVGIVDEMTSRVLAVDSAEVSRLTAERDAQKAMTLAATELYDDKHDALVLAQEWAAWFAAERDFYLRDYDENAKWHHLRHRRLRAQIQSALDAEA